MQSAGPSFPHRGAFNWRFEINVFIGAVLVWAVLRERGRASPIWAVAAMVAPSDPQVRVSTRMFRSRMTNGAVGCGVGLAFLLIGGLNEWKLPFALAATVLFSAYLLRIPTMERQAPITAALVIASAFTQHTKIAGIESGLIKVAEVLCGCVVGLGVSSVMARVWPRPDGTTPDAWQRAAAASTDG